MYHIRNHVSLEELKKDEERFCQNLNSIWIKYRICRNNW
jgi:hypothetical protein